MDKQGFQFPKSIRPEGKVQTSVLVSQDFYRLAKQHNLRFSDAIRVGLGVMFAEMGLTEYDTTLNLYRKMLLYKEQLEKTLDKLSS